MEVQEHFNSSVARTFLSEATREITHEEVFDLTPEALKNVFILHSEGDKVPETWHRYNEENLAESQKLLLKNKIKSYRLRIFEPIVK